MRLLVAGIAALSAVALAVPSFAQEAPPATPSPIAKPKPGTAAYCNTLKSAPSRNACLKRVHASAAKPAPAATHTKPKKLDPAAPKPDSSAQTPPPAGQPAPPATNNVPSLPPLPQKTI